MAAWSGSCHLPPPEGATATGWGFCKPSAASCTLNKQRVFCVPGEAGAQGEAGYQQHCQPYTRQRQELIRGRNPFSHLPSLSPSSLDGRETSTADRNYFLRAAVCTPHPEALRADCGLQAEGPLPAVLGGRVGATDGTRVGRDHGKHLTRWALPSPTRSVLGPGSCRSPTFLPGFRTGCGRWARLAASGDSFTDSCYCSGHSRPALGQATGRSEDERTAGPAPASPA